MTNEAAQLQEAIRNEVVSREKQKIVRPYIQMEEIRKAYPNPVPNDCGRDMRGKYCVGGAFLKFLGEYEDRGYDATGWFPYFMLAEALMNTNPNIGESIAMDFTWDIVRANDSGDFDGAWQILKEALEYGRDVEPRISAEDQR